MFFSVTTVHVYVFVPTYTRVHGCWSENMCVGPLFLFSQCLYSCYCAFMFGHAFKVTSHTKRGGLSPRHTDRNPQEPTHLHGKKIYGKMVEVRSRAQCRVLSHVGEIG